MFNVLPQEEKIAIQKEYRVRRLIVIGVFFIITLIIGLILLFPSYLVSQINAQNTASLLEAIQQELQKSKSHVATPEDISALREKIALLNAAKSSVSVSNLFSIIVAKKGNAVQLSNFTFKKNSDGTLELAVGGNARTRDALTQFSRALEADPAFSAVDLPISSLAKDKDIDFTMTITVRQI